MDTQQFWASYTFVRKLQILSVDSVLCVFKLNCKVWEMWHGTAFSGTSNSTIRRQNLVRWRRGEAFTFMKQIRKKKGYVHYILLCLKVDICDCEGAPLVVCARTSTSCVWMPECTNLCTLAIMTIPFSALICALWPLNVICMWSKNPANHLSQIENKTTRIIRALEEVMSTVNFMGKF
jgi:hypothetical protein